MEAIHDIPDDIINTKTLEERLQAVVDYDYAELVVYVKDRISLEILCRRLRLIDVCDDATQVMIDRVLSIQENLDSAIQRANCGMYMWARTKP